MSDIKKQVVTVSTEVDIPVKLAWELWTCGIHIMHWNYAIDTWQTSWAECDPKTGGEFVSRMEAKDGSMGFDFAGKFSFVETFKKIEYVLGDDRRVSILFEDLGNKTRITESFDTEIQNTPERQREGWQAILDNYKKYAESKSSFLVQHFETFIKASPEKVYACITGKETYPKWTSAFNANARYEGSWEKNSKILFLGADSDGDPGGMVSRIKENIAGKFLSIEHNGLLEKGKERFDGPMAEMWKGSLENYTFRAIEGGTLFSVDFESNEDFRGYFNLTWPEALAKLKSICEAQN
jgi:uncharacterized protein YndB with AHSA1/START domain